MILQNYYLLEEDRYVEPGILLNVAFVTKQNRWTVSRYLMGAAK